MREFNKKYNTSTQQKENGMEEETATERDRKEEAVESDDRIVVVGKENTVNLIPLDLPRTFPCLSFFQVCPLAIYNSCLKQCQVPCICNSTDPHVLVLQVEGPCHEPLGKVLEAYVCLRPDIGYVQGMSYLAAVMLLYMDPLPAFSCLANLLNRPLLLAFYRMDMTQVLILMAFFLVHSSLSNI